MTNLNNTLSAKQIRELKIENKDVMGFAFQNDGIEHHYLTINGKRFLSFTNSCDRRKSFNKIKRMGFGLGSTPTMITDEDRGIIQASKNGENPFAYSVMYANSEMNKIVK